MSSSPLHQLPRIARTSDMVGSHTQRSTVSQLNLIRMKIQERCLTSHELQQSLRRIKPSSSKYITGNDFRVILLKFGVSLTPDELSKIFTEFDTEKTGSINFNSFARWVTNDTHQRNGEGAHEKSQRQKNDLSALHGRLSKDLKHLPSIFKYEGTKMVDYDMLLSAFSQVPNRSLSDKDLRQMFRHLDVGSSGAIPLSTLLEFAKSGTVSSATSVVRGAATRFDTENVPSLDTCINRVCGLSTDVLAKCFERMPRNSPLSLSFNEFLAMLHAEGLGNRRKDAENLFVALGGDEDHSADIGLLLDYLRRVDARRQAEQKKLQASCRDKRRKKNEVADYVLRDETQERPALLASRSGPGTAEGRRGVSSPGGQGLGLGQRASSASKRIDHKMTLNTQRADRHFKEAIRRCYKVVKDQLKLADAENTGYIAPEKLGSIINRFCMSLPSEDFRYLIQNIQTDSQSRVNWQQFLLAHNAKPPGEPDLDHRHTHREPKGGPTAEAAKTMSTASLNPSAAASRGTMSWDRVTPQPRDGNDSFTGNMQAGVSTEEDQVATRMKKGWQKLLKACQQLDSKRRGVVRVEKFLAALQRAGLDKVIAGDVRQQLMEHCTVDQGAGLLDYTKLIRKYLVDGASQPVAPRENAFQPKVATTARDLRPAHPWEFEYTNAAGAASAGALPSIKGASVGGDNGSPEKGPYWKQACAKPKDDYRNDILNPKFPRGKAIHALQLASQGYTPEEAARYFSQFDQKVLHCIRDLHRAIEPHSKRLYQELRAVAQPLKRNMTAQRVPQSLEVLTPNFKTVFDELQINLRRASLLAVAQAFRGKGMPEVVRVDEMLAAMKMLHEADQRNPPVAHDVYEDIV